MPSSINKIMRERNELPREITVWLGMEDVETNFSCVYCKKTLFKHQQRVMALLDETTQPPFFTAPISIQCASCGCIYHIQGII